MGAFIRQNTCGNCRFRHLDEHRQVFCRRNPPNNAIVVVKGPDGQVAQTWQSSYPLVLADWWCGEWTGFAIAQELPKGEAAALPNGGNVHAHGQG